MKTKGLLHQAIPVDRPINSIYIIYMYIIMQRYSAAMLVCITCLIIVDI